MYCGSCSYWDNDVCYKHGKHINFNDNICEYFIPQMLVRDGLRINLKK